MVVKFGSYKPYSEVFGEVYPLEQIKSDLRTFHRDSVLVELAGMNAIIQIAKVANGLDDAQRILRSRFLDRITNQKIVEKYVAEGEPNPVVFWRHHALIMMRLALEVCSNDEGFNRLDTVEQRHSLGMCCYRLADHLNPPEEAEQITNGSAQSQRDNLSIQLGVATLLSNIYDPEDIKRLMARADTLITDCIPSERVLKRSGGFHIAEAFEVASGLSTPTFRDFAFAVAAYYIGLDLHDVATDFSTIAIHEGQYLSSTDYDQTAFEKFMSLCSADSETLAADLPNSAAIPVHYDFERFRNYPFLRVGTNKLVCLDLCFFLERFGAGLQWALRRAIPNKQGYITLSTFGLVFEEYVSIVMRRMFPTRSILASPFIPHPDFRPEDEALDGLYIPPMSQEHLFAFQYKGGFINSEVRYSMELPIFESELDKARKFGSGEQGAVRQLYNFLRRAFPRDSSGRESPGINLDRITKVTPVVITQDPFFRVEFSAAFLDRRLRALLNPSDGQREVSDAVQVTPVEVIDIDTLELLVPHVIHGDFRFEQIINAHLADDPERLAAFSRFFLEYAASTKSPKRMNEDAEERYGTLSARLKARIVRGNDSE